MEEIAKLKELLASLEEESTKFFVKENNAAGTRVRKISQEMRKELGALRAKVTDLRNTRKEAK